MTVFGGLAQPKRLEVEVAHTARNYKGKAARETLHTAGGLGPVRGTRIFAES